MSRVVLILKTNVGGAWVVPQLIELTARGHTVTAILPSGDGRLRKSLDMHGIAVVESPFNFSFRPSRALVSGLVALRRTLRDLRPDAVFYHLFASALAARICSLGLGLTKVHMVAGPLYLESLPIRTAERLLCRLDTHLIAGSVFTAELYRSLGMPAERITAIPYGVNLDHFTREEDGPPELHFGEDKPFSAIMVAFVYAPKRSVHSGRGIKGHDVLLDSWRRHIAKHPDSRLLLVGGGFDDGGEDYRRQLVQSYLVDSDPSITWLSSVEDVRSHYRVSHISIAPSLSENHGAALEASAMSVPSIVSDAGALPEAVSAESGWVVHAGDVAALERALDEAWREWQSGQLETRGKAARRKMELEFSEVVSACRVANAIEAAVAA